jgi:NarL family two-component system response regulator LiaR
MSSDYDAQQTLSNDSKIRVLVVDDHPLILEGIEKVVSEVDDIQIVGTAANAKNALAKTSTLHPHIVLLDLVLEGIDDGLDVARKLSVQHPEVRVIVFTYDRGNANDMLELMLHAGVRGYILKDKPSHELVSAIRLVFQGKIWIDPTLSGSVISNRRSTSEIKKALSDREVEVLGFLAQGMANREIADKLSIAHTTVGTHLHNIYKEIGVESRSEAIVWAFRNGIVTPNKTQE